MSSLLVLHAKPGFWLNCEDWENKNLKFSTRKNVEMINEVENIFLHTEKKYTKYNIKYVGSDAAL